MLTLTLPYQCSERVGAGDAQDYAEHLADFIVQVRHGVFPVLVGQSRYAFNGAFNPLRTAPYHQYFGGALDGLTFGLLNPFAIQNLEIILSLTAAGFSSYLLLSRLEPRRGWLCLCLALLFVSCPGVLALVFEGDMIPSWLTLPYLPVVVFLIVRVADAGASPKRLVALAVATAAIWWAHAPIAMWLSFIAIPVVAVRLLLDAGWPDCVFPLAAALGVFAVRAGYEFVSVAQLSLPVIMPKAAAFTGGTVVSLLRESWKGFLHPTMADGSHLLSDLQLSPALWGCLAFSLLGWRRGGWGLRALLLASAALLVLMVPLPSLAGRLWAMLPVWVGQITDQWPAQRFFPILSAIVPFAFLRAWGALASGQARRLAPVLHGMLVAGCLWGLQDAVKLIELGYRAELPEQLSRRVIEPQNSVFSVYSYAMLGTLPRYYSFGAVSPDLELHLLDPRTLRLKATNQASLLARPPRQQERGGSGSFVPSSDGAVLRPDIQLQPGSNYLLDFRFAAPVPKGTLVLSGKDLWRKFPLPRAGGDRAFGAAEGWSTINLRLPPNASPTAVHLYFVSANGNPVAARIAALRVVPYQPEDLPFRVVSLIPYRIEAHSAGGGWLETAKIFIPGYRGRVNGETVEVRRSPDGLVMVRIPPGTSQIEIDYPGSGLLRTSFWISLAAWLALPLIWFAWEPLVRLSGRLAPGRGFSFPPVPSPDARPVSPQ